MLQQPYNDQYNVIDNELYNPADRQPLEYGFQPQTVIDTPPIWDTTQVLQTYAPNTPADGKTRIIRIYSMPPGRQTPLPPPISQATTNAPTAPATNAPATNPPTTTGQTSQPQTTAEDNLIFGFEPSTVLLIGGGVAALTILYLMSK